LCQLKNFGHFPRGWPGQRPARWTMVLKRPHGNGFYQ
jgi:hypothetical protein